MTQIDRRTMSFPTAGSELLVGGIPVSRLAERVGSTPFFAYDRSRLDARVGQLRAALPHDVHLSYAVKANPMPAVVQHLSTIVDSLDVASGAEMRVALDTPVPPAAISFAGPGKSVAELTQAVAAGVLVELESPLEAERLTTAAERLGVRPQVAVRVNPDFEVKGSGMRMGGGAQQFGVDAEEVPALLKELGDRDVDVVGFHVFSGSQNLHADILAQAQARTVELVLRLADDLADEPTYLNIGGGFGIPYYDKDVPLDLGTVGANLESLLAARVRPRLPGARVVVELGRYIVGEAGVYVTRVVDRKLSRGSTFLVVDGGMHHQLAASGNFGQVIRRNYPIAVANRMDEADSEVVQVVGSLCTPLDLLGDKVALPRAEVDDLVVVHQAGAYGLTASPTAFLSHPQPLEVLV
ncbi:pyridoxal-dependent decarboxylase, exosortase A system-associated [Nocardioides sp. CER19]|uniref:pyridoxal-dependent decarboxylase, exosortase A system-associated n=1 Tax=Nocardioides sp. CER19 TaxID=3038538 RepID=UPI00244A0124|nr:pyridoxal-dependent decarboxylase, exosortase A system-associated [Nocardioides sp. CER19]MDH2414832.1 pyridoxal-dependent decarboxylase, exosortase A system-associated [Nocardioides sp. CER19]